MGFVATSGQSKAFTGTPSSIPDHNSIQQAIAGTLSTPSNATRNLQTLASESHKDMFVPKRSTNPVDCLTFRGYPQLTFNVSYNTGEVYSTGGGNYGGSITINLNSNSRFVGFPYRLVIQVWTGGGFTPPEPDNPGGPSNNYTTSTLNIPAGTTLTGTQTFTPPQVILENGSANFEILITYYRAVDGVNYAQGNAYFANLNTGTEVSATLRSFNYTVSAPVLPYPFSHVIYLTDASSCEANVIGQQTVFANTDFIASPGVQLSASNSSYVNITNNVNYHWFTGNTKYRLTLRTVSGVTTVLNVTNCGTGSAPTQ
jgi:hypothetical protein